MEKDALIRLIQNPESIDAENAELLQQVAISYPYCQNTYFLLAKYAQISQDDLLVKKIKTAATVAYDRGMLRKLIEGEDYTLVPSPLLDKSNLETVSTTFNKDDNTSVLDSFQSSSSEETILDSFTTTDKETETIFSGVTASVQDTNDYVSDTITISEEDINEAKAMEFVQEGQDSKAIEVYKQLIARYPEKDSYYRSQISILSGEEFTEVIEPVAIENTTAILSEQKSELSTTIDDSSTFDIIEERNSDVILPESDTSLIEEISTEETSSFFEDLNLDKSVDLVMPPQDQENIDDGIDEENRAVSLFNEGKVDESVQVYKTLMEKYPEKKSFYETQIEIMKGNTTINESIQDASDVTTLQNEDSFFDTVSESSSGLSESDAIDLFNQGKTDEAIKIYDELIRKYPDKKDYYLNQIDILKD